VRELHRRRFGTRRKPLDGSPVLVTVGFTAIRDQEDRGQAAAGRVAAIEDPTAPSHARED
jgi:hypothetical protein